MNELKSLYNLYRIDSIKRRYIYLTSKTWNKDQIKKKIRTKLWPETDVQEIPEGQSVNHPNLSDPKYAIKANVIDHFEIEKYSNLNDHIINGFKINYNGNEYKVHKDILCEITQQAGQGNC